MKKKILIRGACLSRAVCERLECSDFEIVEFDKQRVDFLLAVSSCPDHACPVTTALPFLLQGKCRDGVAYLERQQRDFFAQTGVSAIIMDDFSELVDVKFIHNKTGTCFMSVYSDMNRSESFWSNFQSAGRLDLSMLDELYRDFLHRVMTTYPGIPVYYLVFPTNFETRAEFLERSDRIRSVINLIRIRFPFLHVIEACDVKPNLFDGLTYHYYWHTYEEMAQKVSAQDPYLKMKPKSIFRFLFHRQHSRWRLRRITLFSCIAIVYWSRSKIGLPIVRSIKFTRFNFEPEWIWHES